MALTGPNCQGHTCDRNLSVRRASDERPTVFTGHLAGGDAPAPALNALGRRPTDLRRHLARRRKVKGNVAERPGEPGRGSQRDEAFDSDSLESGLCVYFRNGDTELVL